MCSPNLWAESRNNISNNELTIEGDRAVFMQTENSIEYTGNVVAFMDGMRILGDRVLVEMSEDRVERITTNGQPANFEQDLQGPNRNTTASAETIVYLPTSGLLELSGEASLTQAGNEVRGALIRYNINLGQLDASGDENTSERVRMQLFLPNNNADSDTESP